MDPRSDEHHHFQIEHVFDFLRSQAQGLSSREARERFIRHGPNRLKSTPGPGVLTIFFAQFRNFIVYILLFAVVFSALLNEYVDAVVILVILVANTLIGFFQEYGAEQSLQALKRLNTVQARVYRDGQLRLIDAQHLVPGDVIDVAAGDRVPADARIIREKGLLIDESNLTGESVPAAKTADAIAREAQVSERHNMLYSSTIVAQGKSQALVTHTGMNTQIGRIAGMISKSSAGARPLTPLQKRLEAFGRRLGLVIIGICVLIFCVLFAHEGASGAGTPGLATVLRFAMIAVSLAVAAVPEALPTIVTVALSIGVKRLLKRGALVRRLASVETLGSCDIICTDKTGTLTLNQMTVRATYSPGGEADPLVFRIGLLCNNAHPGAGGDPTEVALLKSAAQAGIRIDGPSPDAERPENDQRPERLEEMPFDNERKLMTVFVRDPDGPVAEGGTRLYAYVKGAADHVLERCSHVRGPDGQVSPFSSQLRAEAGAWLETHAARALRVLGFAYRPFKNDAPEAFADFAEEELIFAGFQAMLDPPRPDVLDSLRQCREAGIRVIMITGDYKATAHAIAREIGLGLLDPAGNRARENDAVWTDEVITGRDLEAMDQAQLERALSDPRTSIFARVSPEHKLRIVTALQKLGHTVAMTGDGVNDAPALAQADIGVAVGSGTEVAKEACDFVLLNDSFTSIVGAIREGRGIYDNIQKFIMLLLPGSLSEVLIITLAVLFGMNLPLTAVMLLWINLVTNGAPALAFSVDPYSRDIMRRPPLPAKTGILPRPQLNLLFFLGSIGTLLGLGLFAWYGGHTVSDAGKLRHAQTMVFSFVVFYELLLVYMIRDWYRVPVFTNAYLACAVLLSATLQAIVLYTPLNRFFGTTTPDAGDLAALAGAGLIFVATYALYARAGAFIARFSAKGVPETKSNRPSV